ncbi:MAG: zinc-dependent alcohol dehydrogenase family protein [Ignavibacteriaceae bacterium]
MKAVVYEKFGAPLIVTHVPDPVLSDNAAIIKVMASGICRSDFHGWLGRDLDINNLPHVPGHEFAGIVEVVGKEIRKWKVGDRVTVPFVCGCGECPECKSGNSQICDFQFQPGFTHWGSFAQYVSIEYADTNLVMLPEEVDFVTAASLGCRFSTAYRACIEQGNITSGKWVAVHGCGGVGLSVIMIANAIGARVIAIDINSDILELAKSLGAEVLINAKHQSDIIDVIRKITDRGADVSIDALGSVETCTNSILCLRKHGRHIQVGLLVGEDYQPRIPMDQIISRELQIFGSHGMQANKYDEMLNKICSGQLNPDLLIGKKISLDEVPQEMERMNGFGAMGITVIDRFE